MSAAQRVLGILALVVGVVAMHAVAGAHDGHASMAAPDSSHQAMSHEVTSPAAPQPPALLVTGMSAPCDDGCPSPGGHLAQVCLMVLTAAVLLLLARRAPNMLARHRVGAPASPKPRAAARPLRPPSLAALCISRT